MLFTMIEPVGFFRIVSIDFFSMDLAADVYSWYHSLKIITVRRRLLCLFYFHLIQYPPIARVM